MAVQVSSTLFYRKCPLGYSHTGQVTLVFEIIRNKFKDLLASSTDKARINLTTGVTSYVTYDARSINIPQTRQLGRLRKTTHRPNELDKR